MDLSKLPRLSKTPTSDVNPSEPGSATPGATPAQNSGAPCPNCASPLRAGARFCDACGAQLVRRRDDSGGFGFGGEAWISIALGIILIFFFPRIIEYWHTRSHPEQFSWTFQNKDGNPISYPQSAYFLPDVAFFAFCAAMVLEGLVLLLGRRLPAALMLSFIVIVGIVGFNIIALAKAYNEVGFQIQCALAVAFGVYMAIFQYGLYRSQR